MIEIGTPLTNVRYTSNYRGAIYGWDQTMSNSGQSRVPHHQEPSREVVGQGLRVQAGLPGQPPDGEHERRRGHIRRPPVGAGSHAAHQLKLLLAMI